MPPVSCTGCEVLQRHLHDLQAENERLRQLDEATRAGTRRGRWLLPVLGRRRKMI
jgi:hypothetical protein